MVGQARIAIPKRGEVYLVNFDPTLGAEIRKTRPAVIVQNDTGNRWSPITIVAAITSQHDDDLYPTEVLISPPEGGIRNRSVILLNQIRSIDRRRLVKRLGTLNAATMEKADKALRISLALT
jgi:mRNA interferase MazF